jgi:hypothetical protein
MLTTERSRESVAARAGLRAARDRVVGWVDAEAARAAAWPFLATRLAFFVIGLAAPFLFSDHATRTPPVPTGSGWLRWDAVWFVGIAEHGYRWSADPSSHFSATAFFPLYPLLIHAGSLAGLNPGDAATLIANAAFLAALYYLYRLIRLDWPAPVATRALWLLALFPTALAFFIPYTESLYLLLAVLTLWYLRQRRWLAAGVAGALGALTRQTGLVLLLPYLVEWGVTVGSRQQAAGRGGERAYRRLPAARALHALLPAVLMPLAVAAHLAYLWRVTGSATAFLQAQTAWHRHLDWPWVGIVATVQRWTWTHPATTPLQQVHMALELGAVLLFLALLIVGAWRLRPSYTVYAGAVWLAALLSPAVADGFRLPLMSSSRFALSVFPSFVVLALLLRRPGAYQAWLSASAMALGFLSAFFVVGGWVA